MSLKWKEEEMETIRNFYPKYGATYLTKKLNRTSSSIVRKAIKMKIKYDKVKEIYLEENLKPIVVSSKNLSVCLEKMNLRSAGGNYKVLKKYIKKYNIPTDHFDYSDQTKRAILSNKTSSKDVLVENSTYSRTNLKKRLIDECLIEYKCKECSNVGEWNDKKLVLQLDHINGVYNDNRLENLRFLCPNCHTQTETFAGKNNKEKKIKEKTKQCACGSFINKKSTICFDCSRKEKRVVVRPPYDQLLEEVEELGYRGTGRKYGVSDTSIRKWVKKYKQEININK